MNRFLLLWVTIISTTFSLAQEQDSFNLKIMHLPPEVDFSFENVCLGDSTKFINTTTFAGSYEWTFGDTIKGILGTSSEAEPTFKFDTVGTYTVTLKAYNGHYATLSKELRIDTVPQAAFAYSDTCLYGSLKLLDESSCADSLLWIISDSATGNAIDTLTEPIPVYTFDSSGVYVVKQVTYNSSGTDSSSRYVHIVKKPIANFQFTSPCYDDTVLFTNLSACAQNYSWTFGDSISPYPNTSTDENPNHKYDSIGDYNVKLVVTNDYGTDSMEKTVKVTDIPPIPDFTWYQKGDTVYFKNLSWNANSYLWEMGDGKFESNDSPAHLYPKAGKYHVTLYAYSTCFTVAHEKIVTVNPTGVFERGKNTNFLIYPNPAEGHFFIKMTGNPRSNILIQLIDLQGNKIKSTGISAGESLVEILWNGLPSGLYYLMIESEDNIFYQKLIISR